MSINKCSVDILLCITEQLCLKDLLALSSCSHSLYYLKDIDYIWKRLCQYDFGLYYNHPNQLYKTLYQHTYQRAFGGRRPCHHLSSLSLQFDLVPLSCGFQSCPQATTDLQRSNQEDIIHADLQSPVCSHCSIIGVSNLFLCACLKIVCDRHSRLHARHCYDPGHSIFMKINTAELFCQACVDWLGGVNSDPAEQYKTQTLIEQWLPRIYPTMTIARQQQKRRYERYLRWQDSPHQIMTESCHGFCFIPSHWMAHWELYVEGWYTHPPDMPIDHDQWRSLMSDTNNRHTIGSTLSINFSPSSSASCDLVVVSHKTWSYLLENYTVAGSPITEEDLRRWGLDKNWQRRLELWKSRLLV